MTGSPGFSRLDAYRDSGILKGTPDPAMKWPGVPASAGWMPAGSAAYWRERPIRLWNDRESWLQPVGCLPGQRHTEGNAWSGYEMTGSPGFSRLDAYRDSGILKGTSDPAMKWPGVPASAGWMPTGTAAYWRECLIRLKPGLLSGDIWIQFSTFINRDSGPAHTRNKNAMLIMPGFCRTKHERRAGARLSGPALPDDLWQSIV